MVCDESISASKTFVRINNVGREISLNRLNILSGLVKSVKFIILIRSKNLKVTASKPTVMVDYRDIPLSNNILLSVEQRELDVVGLYPGSTTTTAFKHLTSIADRRPMMPVMVENRLIKIAKRLLFPSQLKTGVSK